MKKENTQESTESPPGVSATQTSEGDTSPLRSVFLGISMAWIVLLASLAVTFFAWYLARGVVLERANDRFVSRSQTIESTLHERLHAYEFLLQSGAGLFASSGEVTRAKWRTYVTVLKIDQHYPGVQGLGFSKRILPAEKKAHIRQIREEGFPNYDIHPGGERPEYTSIIFLEPFDWRNQRAFGYDMFSEPTRKEAMVMARDSGSVAMSGKITLLQETEKDVQAGFLIYLPVYRKGEVPETPEQRREALTGYVYSPFRMSDFMQGLLLKTRGYVELQIFDGDEPLKESLLYPSGKLEALISPSGHVHFATYQSILEFAGRRWLLVFKPSPYFEETIDTGQVNSILLLGSIISLLLFFVVLSLTKSRNQALYLANMTLDLDKANVRLRSEIEERKQGEDKIRTLNDELEKKVLARTQQLAESQTLLSSVFDSVQDGIVVVEAQSRRYRMVNTAMCRMLGYSREELLTMGVQDMHPSNELARIAHEFEKISKVNSSLAPTLPLKRKDGSIFYADVNGGPMMINGVPGIVGAFRDITERKHAEEKILTLNRSLEEKVQQLLATQEELEQHRAHLEQEVAQRTASLTEAQRIAHLGNWEWDLINNTLNWSDEMYRIFGYAPQQFDANYEAFLNAVHPEDRHLVDDTVREALERQHTYSIEHRILQPDGTLRYVHGQAEVMRGDDGQAISMVGTLQDITENKLAVQALAASELRFRTILDVAADGIAIMDAQSHRLVMGNRAFCDMLGYRQDELPRLGFEDLHPKESLANVQKQFERQLKGKLQVARDMPVKRKDGSVFFADISTSLLDYAGRPAMLGIFHDITERMLAEQTASDERNFSNTLIASLPDLFFVVDSTGRFIRWNDRLREVRGHSDSQIAVTNALDTIHEADRPQVAQKIQEAFELGAANIVVRLNTKTGIRDFNLSATRVDTAKGAYLIGIGTDITERILVEAKIQKLQEQLREQTLHDPLTGLYNRRYLDEAMGRELIRAARNKQPIGIVMCDLDHFKAINDTYGHLAGDEVLRVFADLLRKFSRGSDIVCRFGGEEFLLLLLDMPPDVAYQRAEQLRTALAVKQIISGTDVIQVTASFGVAGFPENGETLDALIHAADVAMYQAKETGRNRVVVASAHEEMVPDRGGG